MDENNMTAKKSNSDEISLADAPQSPTSDAARVGGPVGLVARHPGLRALEAVVRDLTKTLKKIDPEAGRRASLTVTDSIPQPDADALRGMIVLDGARSGHEERYGTTEEKLARFADYQAFIDVEHARWPRLSYTALAERAAKHFKCSAKTIKRHTKNPHKLA
jgi:hypothetical protein